MWTLRVFLWRDMFGFVRLPKQDEIKLDWCWDIEILVLQRRWRRERHGRMLSKDMLIVKSMDDWGSTVECLVGKVGIYLNGYISKGSITRVLLVHAAYGGPTALLMIIVLQPIRFQWGGKPQTRAQRFRASLIVSCHQELPTLEALTAAQGWAQREGSIHPDLKTSIRILVGWVCCRFAGHVPNGL